MFIQFNMISGDRKSKVYGPFERADIMGACITVAHDFAEQTLREDGTLYWSLLSQPEDECDERGCEGPHPVVSSEDAEAEWDAVEFLNLIDPRDALMLRAICALGDASATGFGAGPAYTEALERIIGKAS